MRTSNLLESCERSSWTCQSLQILFSKFYELFPYNNFLEIVSNDIFVWTLMCGLINLVVIKDEALHYEL